jgi:DNA end-binding protein Ku
MKPRSIWKGHLKLELITLPVRLYTMLNEAEKVSFNQLHKGCHQRLRQELVCPIHGKTERDQIVKGYEIEPDRYVVVDPTELDAIKLESTRCIELIQFVAAANLDPALLDTPHYLGPDGPVSESAFAVLREAMRRRKRIGLGQVIMGGRERLVALRPEGKGMVLTSLRHPAEIRQADQVFEHVAQQKPDPAPLKLAEQLIENKVGDFDPAAFPDRYQSAVRDLITVKLNGTPPIQVLRQAAAPVIDLVAALQQSLAQTSSAKNGSREKSSLAA